MNKPKTKKEVSNTKSKPKRQVVVQTAPAEPELSPEAISKAIQKAAQELRGLSLADPYEAWSKVAETVLDILALPPEVREETREFLVLLIETDPTLQEAIEEGTR